MYVVHLKQQKVSQKGGHGHIRTSPPLAKPLASRFIVIVNRLSLYYKLKAATTEPEAAFTISLTTTRQAPVFPPGFPFGKKRDATSRDEQFDDEEYEETEH